VFISNVGYSQAYTNAIEQKQVQVQQAEQAQAKVAQSRAEAEQNVAIARGKAEAVVLAAKAQAQSLALKGKALRDNPQILQLEAIDKINPNATIICQSKCPSFITAAGK
jgi:regulator of protease activity HflC (stomatin/prohibitin superfamily)